MQHLALQSSNCWYLGLLAFQEHGTLEVELELELKCSFPDSGKGRRAAAVPAMRVHQTAQKHSRHDSGFLPVLSGPRRCTIVAKADRDVRSVLWVTVRSPLPLSLPTLLW